MNARGITSPWALVCIACIVLSVLTWCIAANTSTPTDGGRYQLFSAECTLGSGSCDQHVEHAIFLLDTKTGVVKRY